LAHKPHDETLKRFTADGKIKRISGWPTYLDGRRPHHRSLWWAYDHGKELEENGEIHAAQVRAAVHGALKTKRWTIAEDELNYISLIGEAALLRYAYTQLRSAEVTLIGGSQRPAWLPVECYAMSKHIFIWPTEYIADLKKLTGRRYADILAITSDLAQRPGYPVLHLDAELGRMTVTQAPGQRVSRG
jgi:hypothetical protein